MKNNKKNRKKTDEEQDNFQFEGFEDFIGPEDYKLYMTAQMTDEETMRNADRYIKYLNSIVNENAKRLDLLRDKIAERKEKDDDILKSLPPIIINNKTTNVNLPAYIPIALIITIILMLYVIYTAISTLSLIPFDLIQ